MRGHSLAAGVFDLLDDRVRDAGVCAVAVHAATEVVDDHLRAACANSKAYSLPRPRPAPVTIATWSVKSIMVEIPSSTRPLPG